VDTSGFDNRDGGGRLRTYNASPFQLECATSGDSTNSSADRIERCACGERTGRKVGGNCFDSAIKNDLIEKLGDVGSRFGRRRESLGRTPDTGTALNKTRYFAVARTTTRWGPQKKKKKKTGGLTEMSVNAGTARSWSPAGEKSAVFCTITIADGQAREIAVLRWDDQRRNAVLLRFGREWTESSVAKRWLGCRSWKFIGRPPHESLAGIPKPKRPETRDPWGIVSREAGNHDVGYSMRGPLPC